MWFFPRKKPKVQTASHLKVDLHSHLIPGIDDGSQSMEESMKLIRGLSELGYQKMITTPHIMSDAYRNDAEIIYAGLDRIRAEVAKENIPVEIEAAAEYYLDDGFYQELKKDRVLTFGERYLLFETSYYSKPLQLEDMIFTIGTAGYQPVMAHPERYRYIKDPESEYGRLKELGVMFQINLNSLGGHYGKQAKNLAEFLVDAGMVDFLGSDLHHMKQLQSLEKILSQDGYLKIFEKNEIQNNTLL